MLNENGLKSSVALVGITVQEEFGYYLVNLITVLLEKAG